jgi:hypothetical protein
MALPVGSASEVVFALKPVTFRYKKEIDPQGIPQFGLVAEDVEAINPNLVIRDKEGKPYSVRYDQVNAMLLNEFLEEHKKVGEQQASIAQLKATVAKEEATIAQQQKDFHSGDRATTESGEDANGRVGRTGGANPKSHRAPSDEYSGAGNSPEPLAAAG